MAPIPTVILTSQGVIAPPYTSASLAEAASKDPQGVYTVARTYERNKALLLSDHLDRLERSAQLEGITVKLDRLALRKALRDLIDQSGYPESRFRITIPRETPDQQYLSLEPYKPVPAEIIARGARIMTVHMQRHNPAAKSTAWATERKSAVEAFPPGIYEGVLVSPDEALLEGTSSNFYAILDGTLRTANDTLVLGGIARRIVLTVAADILPVMEEPVHIDRIAELSEAFLTSAGRGVIPIVEIDGRAIGDGTPGPLTLKLRAAYDAWATNHLEPI